MAVLWMDSFEQYYDFGGEYTPNIDQGEQFGYHNNNDLGLGVNIGDIYQPFFDSGNAARETMNDKNYDYFNCTTLGNQSTVIAGFHVRSTYNSWASWELFKLGDGIAGTSMADSETQIEFIPRGYKFEVWRGPAYTGGTLLGTTSKAMRSGWTFVEVKVSVSSSTGTVDILFDGENVLSLTSQNTQATANAYINSFEFGHTEFVAVTNLYVTDGEIDSPKTDANGFLGPVEVHCLAPTSDNSPNQWTVSTGTDHYAVVDTIHAADITNLDTDYNSTGTSGNIESYGYEDLYTAGGTWTVIAVQPLVRCQRVDNTSSQTLTITCGTQVSATNTVTEYDGAGKYWEWIWDIYDYSTGTTDWTATTVNSLTVDVEYD